MGKGNRYDASGLDEAQFELGSRNRVLKNLLGIKSKREMDRIEAREQLRALSQLYMAYDRDHRFTAADVCSMHKLWLGSIYQWAGHYRQVNLEKDHFPFAAAEHIPRLMTEFERGPLRTYTPCNGASIEETVEALAVVHTELMLIHPFREGNGRLGRLLAVMMGLQAGLPMLAFEGIRGRKREDYFAAIRAGLDRDYEPMKQIFSAVVRQTFRKHAKPSS